MTSNASTFWRGIRVLVTGHTGFKGSWLALWLARLGAHVTGVALPPATKPNLFSLANVDSICTSHFCDIRELSGLRAVFQAADPEIVFHLAAQPLVRESYRQPVETFATNVLGTAHVLEAMRGLGAVRASVIVTTDKVYEEDFAAVGVAALTEHTGSGHSYRETDTLGGHDPYAASKAASEIVVQSYRRSFLAPTGNAVATARAGNVIGGGDWAPERIIPDAVRSWQGGLPLVVRRPEAVRPWQHVLEPISAYMTLAHRLWNDPHLASAYNFGPTSSSVVPVRRLVELANAAFGKGETVFEDVANGPHEAAWLSLNAEKAEQTLAVRPRWDLETAVGRTMNWYARCDRGESAAALCRADIDAFEAAA